LCFIVDSPCKICEAASWWIYHPRLDAPEVGTMGRSIRLWPMWESRGSWPSGRSPSWPGFAALTGGTWPGGDAVTLTESGSNGSKISTTVQIPKERPPVAGDGVKWPCHPA
jgi:hypothetical protein